EYCAGRGSAPRTADTRARHRRGKCRAPSRNRSRPRPPSGDAKPLEYSALHSLWLAVEPKRRLLFVKQRLPVCRHRSVRSGRRLIQRMRLRSGKFWAGEGFLRTIVVKPMLARLETGDNRVTRSGKMFRCMLTWRTIAAADVTALRASAQMKPPSARA